MIETIRRLVMGLAIAGMMPACGLNPKPKPPATCPDSCPLGSACTDPAAGCVAIPPPGPACEEGQSHSCWHWPPDSRTWLYACPVYNAAGEIVGVLNVVGGPAQCPAAPPPPATCPACPEGQHCTDPAVGCVPKPVEPPPGQGCVIAESPTQQSPQTNTLGVKVNEAMRLLKPECEVGGTCLINEYTSQSWQSAVNAELRKMGLCAGQHEPGVSDEIATAPAYSQPWQGFHVFAGDDSSTVPAPPGTRRTVVWSPQSFRGSWLPPGTQPPPSTGACSDPITPKVNRWGGPKPHNKVNDSTPLFYGRETQRWDGTTITGYCEMLGMGDKLHCPARNECPGIKCEERVPCEEIGVSGVIGGKPLWRSDGQVHLTDNPYQATCTSCTWLEVCAADGTYCGRCDIDPATGLCRG